MQLFALTKLNKRRITHLILRLNTGPVWRCVVHGGNMCKKRDNEKTQASIPIGFAAYSGDCYSRPQLRTIYLQVDRASAPSASQLPVRRPGGRGAPQRAPIIPGSVPVAALRGEQ
jgi:hypothetical protein